MKSILIGGAAAVARIGVRANNAANNTGAKSRRAILSTPIDTPLFFFNRHASA
jgi:hypothetical protein